MKITRAQLRSIIKESINEIEAEDKSVDKAAKAFADKYGKMGHTTTASDGSLIIHVRARLLKQFGQDIDAAIKENGWTTSKIDAGEYGGGATGDIVVYTSGKEIKAPQKKSRFRRMLGI